MPIDPRPLHPLSRSCVSLHRRHARIRIRPRCNQVLLVVTSGQTVPTRPRNDAKTVRLLSQNLIPLRSQTANEAVKNKKGMKVIPDPPLVARELTRPAGLLSPAALLIPD